MLQKMMFGNEDLGLSLSLSCPEKNAIISSSNQLQLNLNPCLGASVSPSPSCQLSQQKSSWPQTQSFPSSDRSMEASRLKTNTLLKGIDVNRLPAATDAEDVGVSSPNSTLSTISGKRSEPEGNEIDRDEQETERACSRGMSDEEDGDGSRKKLRLSKDQSAVLEESFKEHSTLNPKLKMALSKSLGLRPRQVEVWFQNRRARTKLKQTEVDCEYLKRCFENLTEENRRLQKEVQELRALKLSPQFYMQMKPPTTLTMCPSCERVVTAPAPPSSSMLTPPQPVITAARPLSMVMPSGAHPPAISFNPWGLGALHSRS